MARYFLYFLKTAAFIVFTCGILGSLGRYYWFFDLFSHFVPQYTMIGGILAFLLLLEKEGRGAVIMFVFAALHAYMMEPLWKKEPVSISATSDTLTLLQFNVSKINPDIQPIEEWLLSRKQKADMLVLLELTVNWDGTIKKLAEKYPYYYVQRVRGDRHIGVFSKLPLNNYRVKRMQESNARVLFFDIKTERYQRPIAFSLMHPPPPVDAVRFKRRNDALKEVAFYMTKQQAFDQKKTHVMLVGDLNVTRWSSHLEDFFRITHLHDAQEGRGYMSTWPSFIGNKFGIAIDHTLLSPKLTVINRETGSGFGSDHLPVITTIAIPTLQSGEAMNGK